MQAAALSPQELQAQLGGGFGVQSLIGEGSMATVYLAIEEGLDRRVAIKVLSAKAAADETAVARFDREAKAAASLTHPNIVQIFRHGRLLNGTPYLVMQYVPGRTMAERLAGEGPLPCALAREVLAKVASALAHAHQHGIIHRDVRPSNLLWDDEREDVEVADFGIAALMPGAGGDMAPLTKTGELLGDPRYISPEQVRNSEVGPMSDVYALGVLGYELTTGEGPYVHDNPVDALLAHTWGDPRALTQIRADADPQLGDLLLRCLNTEPKHRPRASDLARALEHSEALPAPKTAGAQDEGLFAEFRRRRIPQFVAPAVGAGAGMIAIAATLEELRDWPSWVLNQSFPSALALVSASFVIAWFHGEPGSQESPPLERVLIAGIAFAWLAAVVGVYLLGN